MESDKIKRTVKDKQLEVPKSDISDDLINSAKAVISVIPLPWTGTALEVFDMIVASPLEKRREKWMQVVADSLKGLEDKDEKIVQRLKENPEFISFLLEMGNVWIRNHEQEKFTQLKNTLINFENSPLKYDRKKGYVNLINELSVVHVKVLKFIYDNRENKDIMNQSNYSIIFNRFISTDLVETTFDMQTFQIIVEELKNRHLLMVSTAMEMQHGAVSVFTPMLLDTGNADKNYPYIAITNYGIQFLDYIETKQSF